MGLEEYRILVLETQNGGVQSTSLWRFARDVLNSGYTIREAQRTIALGCHLAPVQALLHLYAPSRGRTALQNFSR